MSGFFRGNRELVRAMNRTFLLNAIRREGKISRTQLTEISGLSVGAVSGIVNELLQNQWVLDIGEGDYTGGRRQTMLRLNPEAGYAIGLKLMENRIASAVTNFETTVLAYDDYRFPFEEDPARLAIILADTVQSSIARAGIEPARFFGVGIGVAGIINSQTGVVRNSPFFGWRDVPLAEIVGRHTHLPVFVENDVNTLTLTEQLFGVGRRYNDFIVVTIGRGIGMGIVIDGRLYPGANGGAGELGHTTLAGNVISERPGYLEELAADPGVLRAVNAGLPNDSPPYATLEEVIAAAQAGDPAARAALAASGERVGIAIANAVNLLAPELLIVSGEGVAAGQYRLDPMVAALRRHCFDGLFDDLEIVIRQTDDQAWARGAASLVMSKVFAAPALQVGIS